MTLDEVLAIVRQRTGEEPIPETKLSTLPMDSLDFLDLLIYIGNIPDEVVPRINTVNDLFLAANGQL